MIKWLSLVLGVIIYLVYSFWLPINDTDEKSRKLNKKDQKEKFIEVDPNAPDPFDAIRKKDKLRSRAEMMIEKKSSSNSNSNT